MRQAFRKKDYQVENKDLDIFLIAGSDNTVIQNEKMFRELEELIEDIVIDENQNIKIIFKCEDKYFEVLELVKY